MVLVGLRAEALLVRIELVVHPERPLEEPVLAEARHVLAVHLALEEPVEDLGDELAEGGAALGDVLLAELALNSSLSA